MSERGAEGILRRESEAKAAAAPKPDPKPSAPEQPVVKQSATKRAATGAAGGAVGGPGGAAAGALTGLLSGGGKGRRSGGNKALVAEFVICLVLLGLSPLAHKGGDVTVGKFLKKGSATAAVFIILGFVSASGQTGRKVATGLGLLMTLTVLLNERSVFGTLVKAVSGEAVPVTAGPRGTGGGDDGSSSSVGPVGSLIDTVRSGAGAAESILGVIPGPAADFLSGAAGSIRRDTDVTSADDIQGDPLVDFFKGAANWVGSWFD